MFDRKCYRLLDNIEFKVSDQVHNLGIRVICAVISNLDNNSYHPGIEKYKNQVVDQLRSYLIPDFIKTDSIHSGFRTLHEKVGRSKNRSKSKRLK